MFIFHITIFQKIRLKFFFELGFFWHSFIELSVPNKKSIRFFLNLHALNNSFQSYNRQIVKLKTISILSKL